MRSILTAVALVFASAVFANPICSWSVPAPRAYEQKPYGKVFVVDFDGDGRMDVGLADTYDPVEDGAFTIRYGLGGGKLSAPQTLPYDVLEVADVFGSPLPDLIARGVQNRIAPFFDILPNLGHRQFGELVQETGDYVHAGADFTGDGRGDMVIYDGAFFTIHERRDYGFAIIGSLHQLRSGVREVDSGDVDGDGDIDVVVLNGSGDEVQIFLNDGTGVVFTERDAPLRPHLPATEIEVADLAGDGREDVITVSPQAFDARIAAWPNAGRDPGITVIEVRDGAPSGLIARDLTGDGKPEVIVSMTYPGHFHQRAVILLNENGTLRQEQLAVFAPKDRPLEAADFTGDGIADMVVPTENGFAILPGNGNGRFLQPVTPTPTGAIKTVGDLDGDGADEIAFQDQEGYVRVAINDGAGNFTVEKIQHLFHYGFISLQIADGELLIVDRSGSTASAQIFRRNANGTWERTRRYDDTIYSARMHDFDGTGFNELVVIQEQAVASGPDDTRPSIKMLKVIADQSETVLFAHAIGPHLAASVAIGDVTGDGKADLVLTASGTSANGWHPPNRDGYVQVFRGKGVNQFELEPITVAQGISPIQSVIGDFNGDGRNDIAFGTYWPEEMLRVAYATETGFASPVTLSAMGTSVNAQDLNDDGITDLLSTAGDEMTIWVGTPAGLVKGDMYRAPASTIRLRRGAPLALLSDQGAIEATCGPTSRRRSVRR